MKIAHCTAQRYAIPLAKPLTKKADSALFREGIILTLQTDSGLSGYGEIAPLDGLHQETLSQSAAQLKTHLSGLLKSDIPENLYPSVRAGIEMALFDLRCQVDPVELPDSAPVNALCAANDDALTEQVENLMLQGFTSIKVKVGGGAVQQEIEKINKVLDVIAEYVSLRLDANRAWTLDQANRFCDAVDWTKIEYIEEPAQNMSDHVDLFNAAVPIALDETLAETPLEQIDPKLYRAAVLKPSVLGGFAKTLEIIQWAQHHHITPVLSSAFQSSLANRLYVLFAAESGISQTPLGLDTQKWFTDDILENPYRIENGKVNLCALKDRPILKQECLKPLEEVC